VLLLYSLIFVPLFYFFVTTPVVQLFKTFANEKICFASTKTKQRSSHHPVLDVYRLRFVLPILLICPCGKE